MNVPFKIEQFTKEENEEMLKYFKTPGSKWIRVGKEKVCLPKRYEPLAADIYNFKTRPEDIWINGVPRSGTTVTQELIWCISKDLDFKTAKSTLLLARFPELDQATFVPEEHQNILLERYKDNQKVTAFLDQMGNSLIPVANNMQGQRFIKMHAKFELLPPDLINTCKVFYICRHPKDVIVSYFHFSRLFNCYSFTGDFSTFWSLYRRNLIPFSDYWQHLADAWKLKDHPNMCFLFYEEIVKDMKNAIKKIAVHVGKPLSADDIKQLVEHVSIENFRNNTAVNFAEFTFLHVPNCKDSFIRNGKCGDWVNYFTPEINDEADKWIMENMAQIPGFEFYKP